MDGVVQLLRSGGVLQVSSLLTLFLEPANKFLLNHFVGAAAVTIYDLAMKVIWGIQHLFGSAMRIFLHIGSQDRDAVGRNFAKVILLLGVPVVGLHIVGAVFLLWAARHWMMIDASQLMAFFGIAAISNFGMTFVTPLYLSLIGRRDLFFIFRTHLVLAVVNLLVSTAMIPLLGLVGSAFGLLVATALNVAAIYGRCGINAATFVSEEQAVSRVKYRIGAVLGLLAATIAWGTYGNDSPLAVFGILLVLAGIMVREPFVGAVLNRIVLKRP
jgi:O-antigen/teichoic acid export membrane protein